jgi:hypothetical protein
MAPTMSTFLKSLTDYENWLGAELRDELYQPDLDKKHRKMKDGAFPFFAPLTGAGPRRYLRFALNSQTPQSFWQSATPILRTLEHGATLKVDWYGSQ